VEVNGKRQASTNYSMRPILEHLQIISFQKRSTNNQHEFETSTTIENRTINHNEKGTQTTN